MKQNYSRWIIEIVVWTGFVVFPIILFPTLQPFIEKGVLNPALEGIIIAHTTLIVFYYFNYFYLLPKFYFTGRYSLYFPVAALCLLTLILIMQSDPNFNPLPSPPFKHAVLAFIFSIIVRFLMVFLLSLGVASYARLRAAEQQKLISELSYLKAQINPHFLFNTLNSLYALAVKKSDRAPEAILKLSSIMRYVITEANDEQVSLDKEISYLDAYVELEKLRLTDKVSLTYSVEGDLSGKRISPMLLIPLVENVFKHGVSTSETSRIEINIRVEQNILSLKTKNQKLRHDKSGDTGLGISNVKKRLDLLYAGKYELTINEQEKDFTVNLVLALYA